MDEFSQNALLRAAQKNDVTKEVFKQLLKKVNINDQNSSGETWLHLSVKYRNEILVNVLLENGAIVNAVTDDGDTALHLSVQYNNKNILKRLLDTEIDVDLENCDNLTAYEIALRLENLDSAYTILEKTSQINVYDRDGDMLIHKVVQQQCTDLLRKLIMHGVNLLSKSRERMTTLQLAALDSYNIGVHMILANEVKEMSRDRSAKALFMSILRRDKRSFKKLLKTDSFDVNKTDSTGRTALQWAVLRRFSFGVDMLLAKGVEVDKQDILGNTALHFAALISDAQMLNKLLSNGADANLQDEDKRAALHFATRLNVYNFQNYDYQNLTNDPIFLSIAKLVKAGGLLDMQDCDGNTPLNLAVKNNKSLAVKALLIWGARTDLPNYFRESCYTFLIGPNISVKRLFLKHKILLDKARLETYNFGLNSHESLLHNSSQFYIQPIYREIGDTFGNEVNAMINLKMGRFRLYDVLTLKTPYFVKNDAFKSIILSNSLKDNYPNYWPMLQASFCRSEVRYRRLQECICLPLFATVNNGSKVQLPVELKLMIFSMLPDEDLFSFIKAADS